MPALILISDDNPVFRKALRQVLESADHWEIVETADGEEALSKFQEFHPNLVVLDLAMPVKDGLSAAREISKLAPDIPIVLYTMHNSAQLELEAQKSGIRKVLSKSDSGQLITTIQKLLIATSQIASAVVAPIVAASIPEVVSVPEAVAIPASASPEIQPEEIAVPATIVAPKDVA
jgi:DNA-binding NarL/FixJ family response regulator